MPERLRVWLWNLTVNLAWAILRRLGASAIDVHRADDEPDDVDVLRAQLDELRIDNRYTDMERQAWRTIAQRLEPERVDWQPVLDAELEPRLARLRERGLL